MSLDASSKESTQLNIDIMSLIDVNKTCLQTISCYANVTAMVFYAVQHTL